MAARMTDDEARRLNIELDEIAAATAQARGHRGGDSGSRNEVSKGAETHSVGGS